MYVLDQDTNYITVVNTDDSSFATLYSETTKLIVTDFLL